MVYLFFYLIEMLSPDACFKQYFGRSDRVYGELIAVSLMIISRQLGSNGLTSSSVLKRKREKKNKQTSSEKINHFELIYRILPEHKNVNY